MSKKKKRLNYPRCMTTAAHNGLLYALLLGNALKIKIFSRALPSYHDKFPFPALLVALEVQQ